MGRRRPGHGVGGGEDVQTLRTARTRLATGSGSVACLLVVLAVPMARGSDAFQEAGARVGGIAFLVLVAGIVLPWPPLIPGAVAIAGGLYAVELAVGNDPLDVAVPGVAAGLLLCAELAYWSLDERERWTSDPGDGLRRSAFVALLGVAALLVSAALLVVADAVRAHGLVFDLVGTAAATALFVVVLTASSERARP